MVTFHYEAMNAAGQTLKEKIDAPGVDEAIAAIRAKGYYPTKLKEAGPPRPRQEKPAPKHPRRSWTIGGVSLGALTEFTGQLSTLQDAGLPIVRSLKVLWQQQRPGLLKNVLLDVATSVEEGATLSEAMRRHPKVFNRLYVNMVQAGETGGVMDVILARLGEFMEKARRLRRRVIGAMIYPTVVITFSVLIVTGIMMFVVPRFQDIFRDFNTTLPALTQWLIDAADFIGRRQGWILVLGSPLGAWLLVKSIGSSRAGRWFLDAAKLRLPIIGRIVAKVAVARFSRTLGTLLAAGVPILDAITIARDTVGNVVFERALQRVHDAIREGETFAAPLRAAHVCDAVVTNMIDVGEETGDLDKMLLKIADKHDDQVDVLIGALVSLLEPVMVIVLGGVVGTIIVALFLPLVQLMTKLSGGT